MALIAIIGGRNRPKALLPAATFPPSSPAWPQPGKPGRGELLLAMGLFVRSQGGADAGLVPFPLGFKPGQHVRVDPDGQRRHHFGLGPKGLILPQVGDVGLIAVLVLQGFNSGPIGL